MNLDVSKIDRFKSILIIGITGKYKYLDEIIQLDTVKEYERAFGDCNLTNSVKLAIDLGVNISDIYVANVENQHMFINIIDIVRNYDFGYIIPVDIKISDYFYNPLNNGLKTYYIQHMVRELGAYNNNSIVITTDTHASLYQGIDDFLNDMNNKNINFKKLSNTSDKNENLIFLMNNLEGIDFANIVLAAMIYNSDVSEYPYFYQRQNILESAIFDIDQTDNVMDMPYFKSHENGLISIENLLNMYSMKSPLKIFTVYRICLHIARELDFEDFIGSFYFTYKKTQILNIVEKYLRSIVGYLIIDFTIDGIEVYDNYSKANGVDIVVKYSIQPIGFKETYISRSVLV